MTKKVETKPAPYNRKRIAWELERTAMGDGYYGNALYVAKELPEATPAVRSLLDRWATGKESGLSDRTNLCAFALQIYAADEESPSAPAAADGGFTAADMMDARQEGRKEAQQLAAVDEAMVDRVWDAAMGVKHNKEPWFPMTKRRLKRALQIALAARPGGSDNG